MAETADLKRVCTYTCRYFEVQILTPGSVRVGWVRPTMHPEVGLGEDEESFAFDGCLVSLYKKLHLTPN